MSIWDGLLAFVLGGCGWSFSEYAIHRFRGHGKKNGSLFQREHRRHHAEAHYFAPASLKVRMAILPLLVIGSLGSLLVNPVIGVSFALGFGLTLGCRFTLGCCLTLAVLPWLAALRLAAALRSPDALR